MVILNDNIEELEEAARKAAEQAYSPFSKLKVGAAVLTERWIFSGCNIENPSLGLTNCAERTAVFTAIASGAKEVSAVVVYAKYEAAITPCGACRQVINEFGPGSRIICICDGPERLDYTLGELLPAAFGLCNLRQESCEH